MDMELRHVRYDAIVNSLRVSPLDQDRDEEVEAIRRSLGLYPNGNSRAPRTTMPLERCGDRCPVQ